MQYLFSMPSLFQSIVSSRFIHVVTNGRISFFCGWIIFHCMCISHFLYSLMEVWCWRIMILRDLFALYLFDWYLITHAVIIRALSGFPDSSVGKESACNAGDPDSIHGLERSPGEGISYPLQYSWASLVAQLVKNLPAMWETSVWSLGWEDPLEKGKATHSSILAWRIPGTGEPGGLQSMGSHRVGHDWSVLAAAAK